MQFVPGDKTCQCNKCRPARIDASGAVFGSSDHRSRQAGRQPVEISALTTVVLTNATMRAQRTGLELATEITVEPGRITVDAGKLVVARRFYISAEPLVLSPCFEYMNNPGRSQRNRCKDGVRCWFLHLSEDQANRFFSGRSQHWISVGREVERILHITAQDRQIRSGPGQV